MMLCLVYQESLSKVWKRCLKISNISFWFYLAKEVLARVLWQHKLRGLCTTKEKRLIFNIYGKNLVCQMGGITPPWEDWVFAFCQSKEWLTFKMSVLQSSGSNNLTLSSHLIHQIVNAAPLHQSFMSLLPLLKSTINRLLVPFFCHSALDCCLMFQVISMYWAPKMLFLAFQWEATSSLVMCQIIRFLS